MKEYLEALSNLAEAFFTQAETDPDRIVYYQSIIDENDDPSRIRPKKSATYAEVKEKVNKVAAYLNKLGVKKGDRIAILSQSRPEWMEADIAALSVGGVVVSVYQSLPWDDVGYILFDSGSKVVFAENQEQVDKLLHLASNLCEIPATEDRPATSVNLKFDKIISFEQVHSHELVEQWDTICSGEKAAPPNQFETLTRDDLAAFVYTSGTTGPPKGVIQSHGNHLANVRQVLTADVIEIDKKIMLFLPLAHSFAKLMGYLGFLTPVQLCFPAIASKTDSKLDPDSATKDIREAGSDAIPLVPRLLEKMQSGIMQKANGGGIAGLLLGSAVRAAKEVYAAKVEGKSAPLSSQIIYALTGFLRKKVKAQLFGSEFEFCISGGAALGVDTAKFFDALGIEILEGYGLTETCVATNVNRPGRARIGKVGQLVSDDIEIKLSDDGEISFRGPNIALGYHGRETATKESWDEDGWFHTGDLGHIDEDGYLSIVGRKKEIIVSSYGKNLAPDPIEQLIKKSPLISQSVLVGDAKAFCTAIVTLDAAAVASYGEDPHLNDEIWNQVRKYLDEMNEDLPNHEKVRDFTIIPEDFTVDNGFLTPTFKVKRKAVIRDYTAEIEKMYEGH